MSQEKRFLRVKKEFSLATLALLFLSTLAVAPIITPVVKAAPSITLSPTNGPVGTTVSVTGSGFTPNGQVEIFFNGAIVTTTTATNTGTITTSFTVPNSAFTGTNNVPAKDVTTQISSATATFTLTTQPSSSPSPTPTPSLSLPWSMQTVDSVNANGFSSLALDSKGNPHISYNGGNTLKYASLIGSAWSIQTVDPGGCGQFTSIALDSDDNPHISYVNSTTNPFLNYASWKGSAWNMQTVDSIGNSNVCPSLALDSKGNPHISYQWQSNYLRYASWNGAGWTTQTVDGPNGIYGVAGVSSLALDSSDNARIAYTLWNTTLMNGFLMYASWNGTGWNVQTVDSNVDDVCFSLALDANNPYITYHNQISGSSGPLKYANWNGSAWNAQIVEAANVGGMSSLKFDSQHNPHVSYQKSTLRYASWNGSAWNTESVETNPVNWCSPLALDPNGNAHISFYDQTTQSLTYAYQVSPTPNPSPTPFPQEWFYGIMVALAAVIVVLLIVIVVLIRRKREARAVLSATSASTFVAQPTPEAQDTSAQLPPTVITRICPQCGRVLDETVKFCPYCGRHLE